MRPPPPPVYSLSPSPTHSLTHPLIYSPSQLLSPLIHVDWLTPVEVLAPWYGRALAHYMLELRIHDSSFDKQHSAEHYVSHPLTFSLTHSPTFSGRLADPCGNLCTVVWPCTGALYAGASKARQQDRQQHSAEHCGDWWRHRHLGSKHTGAYQCCCCCCCSLLGYLISSHVCRCRKHVGPRFAQTVFLQQSNRCAQVKNWHWVSHLQ